MTTTTTTTNATALASQYATQVGSDLERNVAEQERIRAEIDALQEQLTALRHDHSVLMNISQALETTGSPAEADSTAQGATVPAPRTKSATASPKTKQAAAKKSSAPRRRTEDKKQPRTEDKKQKGKAAPAKASPAKAASAKPAEPTLVDLVCRHLTAQTEPRSAAEIATDLGQAHPDRGIKATVVRTTLENLVAKNRAQRSKQGKSVFYTAPDEAAAPEEKKPQPDQAA